MRNILSTKIVLEPETRTSSESKMSHPAFAPPSGFGRLLLADCRQHHRPQSVGEIPSAVDRPERIEPYSLEGRTDHRLGRANSLRATNASLRKRSGPP